METRLVTKRRRVNPVGAASGFTLTEVLITIVIVSILAAIAIPSFTNSITKSKRRAAQACLSSLATQMERYYTTNLRYCEDTNADSVCDSNDFALLPNLECRSNANTGKDYTYSATVQMATYTLQAAPNTAQASKDVLCGTLTLSNTGAKDVSGTGGRDSCW